METEERYRSNVALLLTDGHGRVLCCERIDDGYGSALQIVQGGIDLGESVLDAALREASEELGIDSSIITVLGTMDKKYCYRWNDEYIAKFPGGFVGQEQQFVCGQMEPGTPMNLDAYHREFTRVFWGTPQQLIEGCWEMKRPGIIAALQYFGLLPVEFSG
jgi:8-oxo-dGTP pyrophosphatase MutT (NUDIX family)